MQAAVLYELKKPLTVEQDIRIPPLKRGQVLVEIAYSSVCHSQIMERRGDRGEDRHLPHLLGHEGSGIVFDIGPGVKKVVPGDRVILGWIKGEGIDSGGTTYTLGEQIINAGPVTTFSDVSVISENRCYKLPKPIPMDLAPLFGCAIPTGAGMIINELKPEPGSTIAIFGMGGVGLSALMATQLFQHSKNIAVDTENSKLELAKELGATHTVNASNENAVEAVKQITGGQGVHYGVDAAGLSRTIEQAFESTRRGGKCLFASHPANGEKIRIDPFDLICGKQIKGTWGGYVRPDEYVPRMAQLYEKGQLPLHRLIDARYPLLKINDAMDDLESKRITRALIEIKPN